ERHRLLAHPIYALVDSPDRLRRFMESHVFAVWDFQSLLKALQRQLTCTTLPWLPTPDAEARRLINEIVLDEESDELPDGGCASHFELYLDGMRDAGADTGPVDRLLESLVAGQSLHSALAGCGGPSAALDFVRRSFAVIEAGRPHCLAAAFTYGREDVIPDMFRHPGVEDRPVGCDQRRHRRGGLSGPSFVLERSPRRTFGFGSVGGWWLSTLRPGPVLGALPLAPRPPRLVTGEFTLQLLLHPGFVMPGLHRLATEFARRLEIAVLRMACGERADDV
ncbi:MAG: DUF3050 domain-containing protein, partial [Planctomycetia bacterium]|nr:DUF3050 domain-containing protein [Planctomycetia bacterium]